LYKINPDFKKKLVAIEGDLELKGLGISEQDRQTLRDNVNIVFHSAATVRFDEPLK
jgi:fatty acyl-CoA reductase